MRYRFLIPLVLLGLFPFLASAQSTLNQSRYGLEYHFSHPQYLTKTYQLHEDAQLQLLNTAKEVYVLLILEPKDLFDELGARLDGPMDYFDLVAQPMILEGNLTGEKTSLEINGLAAVQGEMVASIDAEEVAYLLTVFDVRDYYCQILCWTPLESKDQYLEDFKKMASSFKPAN